MLAVERSMAELPLFFRRHHVGGHRGGLINHKKTPYVVTDSAIDTATTNVVQTPSYASRLYSHTSNKLDQQLRKGLLSREPFEKAKSTPRESLVILCDIYKKHNLHTQVGVGLQPAVLHLLQSSTSPSIAETIGMHAINPMNTTDLASILNTFGTKMYNYQARLDNDLKTGASEGSLIKPLNVEQENALNDLYWLLKSVRVLSKDKTDYLSSNLTEKNAGQIYTLVHDFERSYIQVSLEHRTKITEDGQVLYNQKVDRGDKIENDSSAYTHYLSSVLIKNKEFNDLFKRDSFNKETSAYRSEVNEATALESSSVLFHVATTPSVAAELARVPKPPLFHTTRKSKEVDQDAVSIAEQFLPIVTLEKTVSAHALPQEEEDDELAVLFSNSTLSDYDPYPVASYTDQKEDTSSHQVSKDSCHVNDFVPVDPGGSWVDIDEDNEEWLTLDYVGSRSSFQEELGPLPPFDNSWAIGPSLNLSGRTAPHSGSQQSVIPSVLGSEMSKLNMISAYHQVMLTAACAQRCNGDGTINEDDLNAFDAPIEQAIETGDTALLSSTYVDTLRKVNKLLAPIEGGSLAS